MDKTGYRILMFLDRTYPCDEAMMETVYTRLLPKRGYLINWIMRRGPSAPIQSEADWNGTPVHLLPNHKPSLWTRPLTWMSRVRQSYKIAEKVGAQQFVDIIQVRNDLLSAYVALMLKKQWGIPFVFQLSFPTTEAAQWQPGDISEVNRVKRKVGAKIKQMLQWWVLRQADLVLAISDWMRAELIARGLPADKVVSFPMGVDTDIRPENYDRLVARLDLGLGDSPTVIYFGTMARLRRLEFLLDVMVQVLAEVPTTKLLLVGSADNEEEYQWLRNESTRRGLDQAIRFVGTVPRARMPFYLSAADVSVAPIPPIPIYTISSPTKVLESLGMAVPVVANSEIPDQFKVITESGGGECVPYNIPAFTEAVVRFLKDSSMAQLAGQRGREYVVRERSYSKLADDINARYSKLIATNQRCLS